MSLADNLVLKNNAAANKTFVATKRSGFRVERLDEATTLALPATIVVDHSTTGNGASLANRHLIQVAIKESDGNGGFATTIVNLTLSVPANAPSSTAAKDALAYIASLLMTTGAANATFDDVLQNQS